MKKSAKFIALLFFTVVFLTTLCSAQTTEFTYQGSLQSGGAAANGNYDFEFVLFDAAAGGAPLGAAVTQSNVAVTNGAFAVRLNFGNQFPGANRYLEIRVRQSGTGSFTTLQPRQPVTSAPYSVQSLNAVNAMNAATATTADNALNLGGIAANGYVLTGDARLTDSRSPLPNSPNYIQNTTTQQAASNFNISGNGTLGGTLTANNVTTLGQFNVGAGRVLGVENNSLFVGIGTGQSNVGTSNTFVGTNTGVSNSSGFSNSFFGRFSGNDNTTGSFNTFIGSLTGTFNTTGSFNTALGYSARFDATNLVNATAIGSHALVTQSNSLVLGSIGFINGATADTNVGIGTTAPTQRLHVVGNGLFTGNLTVNGTLNATLPGGSSNYIQNTTAQQATSNFNISGTGNANILNAATQYNLGGVRIFSNNGQLSNLYVGVGVAEGNPTGDSNAYFGFNAGNQQTSGRRNSFFGFESGLSNTTGSYNVFSGAQAGRSNTSGVNNTFVGNVSGFAVTTGSLNAFFGNAAGVSITTGDKNTFLGGNAGQDSTSGSFNTFLGFLAGRNNLTGSFNTFVGAQTNPTVGNLTNATAVGYLAAVSQSNSLVLGSINGVNSATSDTNVGIGTTAPTERLHVVGNGLFSGNLTVTGTLSGANQFNLNGSRVLSISGTNNLFVGVNTGQSNTGSNNTFVGYNVGAANTTGLNNSFFGSQSGVANTMGGFNSFFGFFAGTANVTGSSNSFFGVSAGVDNSTGSGNSFFGNSAGKNNTDGILNSFFGIDAGKSNQTGSFNTMIGNGANVGGPSLSNATAIGSRAFVTQNNSLVLGSINGVNSADSDTNVGIGTTAPLTRLDVRGNIFIGLTQSPSANYGNSLFLANDNGDSLNSFRLDAADNNLFIIARSASGATAGAGITFRTAESGGGEINRMSINPDGTVSLSTLGTGGLTSLCRNSSNQISTCSSSIRYKTNINPFNSGLDLIRKLRPVSFNWKDGGMADLGLVAEEVNKAEPLLTTTNERGEVEGVKYDRVGVVLINAVQEQQTQIEAQQKQIGEQKDLLQKQQAEIEALKLKLSELEQLKQLVCAQNASAQICQPKNQ